MLTDAQATDYVRRHDGVPAKTLSDGSALLEHRAFWAAMFDGAAAPELITELFDGAGDDTTALHEQIRSSAHWPVIPISDRFTRISWYGPNLEGGDDYVVLAPGRAVPIAARQGRGYGPGLSWPELTRIATTPRRLLLALPALGDADAPPEAVDQVTEALLTVGGDARPAAREVARQMLESPVCWVGDDDMLVCDGEFAVRTPGALPDADLRLVTQALA
ncbi:hypothetical protein [Actinoplanes siamensis]|uniref:Uncharacterized protein n=1 Tax=Actinoplanes siamensis TaxID=1223317 RepID=A0A919N0H2_9ACTN|nr:hypothetical protein [Actinoplanes siamensis]GIF02565.1 hypothetical protein Asi03nite_01030 [Actinoplanes siamensis]